MRWLVTGVMLLAVSHCPGEVVRPVQGDSPAQRIRLIRTMVADHQIAAHWKSLVASFDDPVIGVRVVSLKALASAKLPESIPAISQVAESKGEPSGIRLAAVAAIQQFGVVSPEQKDWISHAHEYLVLHGNLIDVPIFDPGFANSRHLTIAQSREQLRKANAGGQTGNEAWKNPVYVKSWAELLPGVTLGSYGRLPSALVLQVIGPDDLLLTNVGPMNDVVRLTGDSTDGISDGKYWHGSFSPGLPDQAGERVVCVGTSTYTDVSGGSRTVPQLVPISLVRIGISFEDYRRLVEK